MERPPIATGKQFRTTFTLWSSMPGTIGALLIILYFTAVLDLGSDGWKWFGFGLLGLTSSLTPYGQWLQHRIDHDIARALDRIDAGQQTREDLVRGYVAARLLPQRCMWVHASNYVIAGLFLPVWMRWAIPDVTAFTLAVLTAGSLTGAGACMPFSLWATGRFVSPTRDYFASQLTPTERAEHAPYASLAAKLAMPVVGVTFGTVTFLALLGYSVAINLLEAQDVNLKTRFLEGAHAAYRANPATTRHLRALARDRGIALEFGVVDLTAAPGMPAAGLALSERELAWMRGGEAPAPTSLQLDSDTTFAWLPLGDGRALVAVSPLRAIVPELGSTLLMVGIVLVGLCGVSFAVALRAGSDTRRVAGLLRAQAERVGAGDFTGSGMIESEDELGAVAHAFAKMTETLGGTLTRVVSTAAQMDEAAGALAQIGATLREVTVAQVRGIERDRKSTRLNSSHLARSRMPSSA